MDDITLSELKEYISIRFGAVDSRFTKLHRHLGHMQNFISETFDITNNANDAVLTDHEARLFDLETETDTAHDTGVFTTVRGQYYNIPEHRELVR